MLKLEFARLNFGKIKDIIDYFQQRPATTLNSICVKTLSIIQFRLQKEFSHPDHPVHRCPDLMAHIGQKLTFRPIGIFSRFSGHRHFLGNNFFRDIDQ